MTVEKRFPFLQHMQIWQLLRWWTPPAICSPLYLFSGLFSVIACVHLLLHSRMAAHLPGNSLHQTYGSLHFK